MPAKNVPAPREPHANLFEGKPWVTVARHISKERGSANLYVIRMGAVRRRSLLIDSMATLYSS